MKNNPLQEYHAAGFNVDQKHCNGFIHVLHRILEQYLRDAKVMPAETQKEEAHGQKCRYYYGLLCYSFPHLCQLYQGYKPEDVVIFQSIKSH